MGRTKEIYLAGGCFWGIDEYFSRVPGVIVTTSGYANGATKNPSYEEVCLGSGHVECVRVEYDPARVSLAKLVRQLFRVIDPTSLNRQGGDHGVQYRTGVYYTDEADLPTLRAVLAEEQEKYERPIVVELMALQNFYAAESYHQDYLKKNPGGYCHVDFSLLDG